MSLSRCAFASILSFACLISICQTAMAADADSIDKQSSDKLAQAKRIYCDSVKAIAADSIRKYEALLKQETAAGHAEAVQAIKKKIDKLKELEADPAGDLKIDQSALVGDGAADADDDSPSAAISGKAKLKQELEKRLRGFFVSLAKEEFDSAKDYLDPKTISLAPNEIVMGYLKIFSGAMNTIGIKKESQIEVKEYTLNSPKNVVKIIPRWQNFRGDWGDGDPQYWILRKGKWYLGDEKELSKSFK